MVSYGGSSAVHAMTKALDKIEKMVANGQSGLVLIDNHHAVGVSKKNTYSLMNDCGDLISYRGNWKEVKNSLTDKFYKWFELGR